MIVEKEKLSEKAEYMYQPPKTDELRRLFNELMKDFKSYLESNGLCNEKYEVNIKLINEINVRVDKRKDYYRIFHDKKLSEVRYAALQSYWILKFKPFLILSEKGSTYNFNINCGFAVYILLGGVSEYIEREYHGKKVLNIDEKYLTKIKYAFKYWDLSKEAIMLIAETLCRSVKDKEDI